MQSLLNLSEDDEGGDEGYDETFNLSAPLTQPHTLHIAAEFFSIKDRFLITSNLGTLWDTGCASGQHNTTITLLPGTAWVRLEVQADCEAVTGTAWNFQTAIHA